ncbi:lipoprotein-releasing ABC transporter permease subunit [Pseudoalteromonas denitrificans]|uniref:Lipoprotein-releasing system permease protein n=1 Tax=Pseudoalteromonas denitrificans DSM 6059 TaxID=1123010 RepID=A0A1I1P8B3_9GAMM|nr:lipoprotein-releasing ABC transporter permease subunit [Pseudoalteromonas denitrificans]SFD06059.1 lipoprotein-releasing system permease protein [Pseudoalteromonas denitrificans DSM 6059]
MFQPVSLFIGLRYSRAAKGNAFISFISFFSITGITLGIMALITVVSVMNGFESKLKQSMLGLLPHIELTYHNEPQASKQHLSFNAIKEQLVMDERIANVSQYIEAEAILQTNKNIQGVIWQGVYTSSQLQQVQNNIEQGSWQTLFEKKYSIAMSRFQAIKLGLKVGDKLRVIVPKASSYTPMGRVPSQRLFTLVAIYSTGSEIDTSLVFSKGDYISRLLKIRKQDNQAPSIRIQLEDPFEVDDVLLTQSNLFNAFEVSDWRKTQGSLFSAVAMEKRIMSLLLGLIILVAVFNIVSALTMMVAEKQSEVAILQTLGLTPSSVKQVFIIQGLYNGLFGALLGGGLGIGFAANINQILDLVGLNLLGGAVLPVLFNSTQLSIIIFGSIFMSFLATLYPATKAAGVRPAEVLRYE